MGRNVPDDQLGSRPRSRAPAIGREAAIADVYGLLRRSDVTLVTLTGPGGGETTAECDDVAEVSDAHPLRDVPR